MKPVQSISVSSLLVVVMKLKIMNRSLSHPSPAACVRQRTLASMLLLLDVMTHGSASSAFIGEHDDPPLASAAPNVHVSISQLTPSSLVLPAICADQSPVKR
jgi:hypothetical protein